MSPNSSEPRYRRRTRVRADHDEAPLQNASEPESEQQAENAEQQFGEHSALGTRASGAGSADGQASALASADPAAKASLLSGMQQQHGNQHVQRVVQRLRVQRYPNKNPDTKDDPGAKTGTPKLIDAIAAKYVHLAKVLKPEQIEQWQKLVDAATAWEGLEKQRVQASQSLYFDAHGGMGGSSADVDRYHALERKANKQAAAANHNRYLDVPTELLLDPDVLNPNLKGGPEEAAIFAFHSHLYDRLVSMPTRVWLGGEVTSVESFQHSLWPVHIANPVFEGELGSEGGLIHWQNLMKASEGLALRYHQVLLQAQAQVAGQMMDISSRPAAYAATDKMREDVFKMRRILQNNVVSSGDESEMLAILRKWSEIDAKSDDATKHGMAVTYNRKSDTPQYDEFIGMTRSITYDYKSLGTAWIGQMSTVFDGLWEEMEGAHTQELTALLARSKMWAGSGRMVARPENIWGHIGKREALAGWGIVSALGQGLTGLFDFGMWAGYRMAGGKGDAPAITPWLSKRQDQVAEAMAGGMGIDLAKEKGLFGLDPFHFARITGKVPAALMTAGMMAPLGEVGVLIGGAQTLKQVDDLVDKIKKMRAAGKSWSDIFKDPQTWVQIVGVVAGAIGAAGGMSEAGSAAKELLGQMGIVANIGQMELIAAAYYAVDDDKSLSGPEKQQRKADLLADFLSTGTMTIDQKYGEAFKQKWEARYAEGVGKVNPDEPQQAGGAPGAAKPQDEAATGGPGAPGGAKAQEEGGPGGAKAKDDTVAAKTGGVKDTAAEDTPVTDPKATESKSGGQAYKGKTPPPIPVGGKGFNEPIGNPMHTEAQGRAVMRRLASGDAGALVDIGVSVPENFNPTGREWGLGRTRDGKFVIIQGATGGVEWGPLITKGVAPLSHTHPLFPGREMRNPGVTPHELISGDNYADQIHVLPSVEDIKVCVDNGLTWHEVQTPYVHQGDGKIGNPTGAEPGVSVILHNARKMAADTDFDYFRVEMEFVSNGQTLWRGEVWAWSGFKRDAGFFAAHPPEDYAHATPTPAEPAPNPAPSTTTKASVLPGTVTVDWSKKLAASGNAGSLGARQGYGVFEGTIAGVPHPVAIKVYPANKKDQFQFEMEGAQAAGRTSRAAGFYGQVDVGPGKLAFAMEKLEGGFVQDESLPTASASDRDTAAKQGKFYASKITQQTIADIRNYRQQILDVGYYYSGEVQGLVDAQGRWKAIDFQGIRPLPTDPTARNEAIQEHVKNFRAQIDEIRNAAASQNTP